MGDKSLVLAGRWELERRGSVRLMRRLVGDSLSEVEVWR